ncbi:MAG: glycosyltransferase [Planctomycetota bacterium]
MKVLFCHNFYRYRGGEDQSFESEVEMLRDHGHEVITYTRNNEEISESLMGRIKTTACTIHNRAAKKDLDRLIQLHHPDILHCNNLFPLISPSIYQPARRAGIPIVQALRNYRMFCANSFFYRDQAVCTKCHQKPAAFSGIRHACYRDSSTATAVVATMQWVHRSRERRNPSVDVYVTPTSFARHKFIDGGLDPARVQVKTNFIHPDPGVGSGHSDQFVFVGRLSREKGLDTVMRAWQELDAPLAIVGDGPLRREVEEFARQNKSVSYRGPLEFDHVLRLLGDARCLIMPSLWFETFGRTIAEAFSRGTPVIASRLGAMAELVNDEENGFLFRPGDHEELATTVRRMQGLDAGEYGYLRRQARRSYENHYSRDVNYQKLIEVYQLAEQFRRTEP